MERSTRLADLLRTFVAPPGLGMSRPRDVQLSGGGRALATVAVLLLALAVGAFIGMSRLAQQEAAEVRALADHGVAVPGQVMRLWSSGDDRRRVNYRFIVDGRPYDDHIKVSSERRRALQVGSPVPVRYLPENPRVNDLEGTPRGAMPMMLPFVIAPAIACVGAIFLLVIRRQRQLLAEGRVAPAIVTGLSTQRTSHGGKHRSLTYEFPLLNGAVGKGKCSASTKPPAIGSVICVVYDPESPRRSMMFPLSLVTPAR